MTLEEVVGVLGRGLERDDTQLKWHVLDTIALLARDPQGICTL